MRRPSASSPTSPSGARSRGPSSAAIFASASLMGIVSGCFVASANRRSYERDDFAGQSWIVSPEGDVLAETTADAPIATVGIDLEEATSARQTYPRTLPSVVLG